MMSLELSTLILIDNFNAEVCMCLFEVAQRKDNNKYVNLQKLHTIELIFSVEC